MPFAEPLAFLRGVGRALLPESNSDITHGTMRLIVDREFHEGIISDESVTGIRCGDNLSSLTIFSILFPILGIMERAVTILVGVWGE